MSAMHTSYIRSLYIALLLVQRQLAVLLVPHAGRAWQCYRQLAVPAALGTIGNDCSAFQTTSLRVGRYHMQAAHGDNDTERPMWAEKGGLDFEGRARWDAWTERKGMKPPRAKVLFVQVRLDAWPPEPYAVWARKCGLNIDEHAR